MSIGCTINGRACACDGQNVHGAEWFFAKDTWQITGILTYADGSPFNLGAGCALQWKMQDSTGAPVGPALTLGSGITVVDPVNGICLITVTPTQSAAIVPGNYVDQLQAADPAGFVSTQWTGPINVNASFF